MTPETMLVLSATSTGDTTTTVTADPPTSVQGNLVTYLATVHPASGKPVPTGAVSFTAGSTPLCAVPGGTGTNSNGAGGTGGPGMVVGGIGGNPNGNGGSGGLVGGPGCGSGTGGKGGIVNGPALPTCP